MQKSIGIGQKVLYINGKKHTTQDKKNGTKGRFSSECMMHFSHCPKNVPQTILKEILKLHSV